MPLFILGFQLQPVGGTVGGARPHPQSWLTTNERWRWTRLDECAVAIGWRRWMPVPHWPTRHLRSVGAHFAIWNSPRQMARGCEAPAIPLLQLRVSHTRYHHFFLFLSLSFFLSFSLSFSLSNSFSIFDSFLIQRFFTSPTDAPQDSTIPSSIPSTIPIWLSSLSLPSPPPERFFENLPDFLERCFPDNPPPPATLSLIPSSQLG